MTWLAGSGHLKPNSVLRAARLSSDEYEESDAEVGPPQIFQVRRIVDDKKLSRGNVRLQMCGILEGYDADILEKSKFGYAFRVRWRGFDESEDTWEPIENFNTTMSKKLRKYCKRKGIALPEEFRDWLLHASSGEEETSGSDCDAPTSGNKRSNSARSPSPQPSGSRPQFVEKYDVTKKPVTRFLDDFELSPTPSPMPPPKKKFDSLFDSSGDEKNRNGTPMQMKKKSQRTGPLISDRDQRKLFSPMGSLIQRKKKRDGSMDSGENERKKSTLKRTPNQVKKKKRVGIIDLDDYDHNSPKIKKIRKKKEQERKRRNSVLSTSDDNKKKEDVDRKRMDHAELMKKAAAITRQLEDEEKRKKEKKQAKMGLPGDKVKVRLAESEKPKKRLSKGDTNLSSSASETEDAQNELEMKKKKKKLEVKMREKGSDKREDGHKKDRKMEERQKEAKLDGKKTETKPIPFRIPKKTEVRREPRAEVKEVDKQVDPSLTRIEKATKRLEVIKKRMENFAHNARQKELRQEEKWADEEEKWRKGMYESGKWTKDGRIKDVPFSFRVEQQQTDTRFVRTLRRCTSAERLPVSFRRLSSIHSMNSLPSKAVSLAEALLEMRVGRKVRGLPQSREGFEEKKKKNSEEKGSKKEEKEKKKEEKEEVKENNELPPATDDLDLKGKTELFIRESLSMADELMPGAATEELIREMCVAAIDAFLSLDHSAVIPILEQINRSECINHTILRLVRIFSPIVNVAVAVDGCIDACDEGQHRRCRMLLTLLMAVSEPHRMSDDENSLLPPNALYEAMEVSAPCQIRAMIRGGCTFDHYYDDEGKSAAHRMIEKFSMTRLVWLIERGLDVNSAIMPKKEKDLASEFYDRPWKIYKESNEKAAFLAQLHSQRLTARSVVWTKRVQGVGDFHLRPLTLVHTLNPHAHFHRLAAVTLCDDQRKGFDRDDAVLLAVHSVTVKQGKGLRAIVRKTKKNVPELRIPYFLIDQATDDVDFEHQEKYECTRARLTIHNLSDSSRPETVELTRLGSNGATTVYKVPKKQANILVSGRRFTDCLLKLDSPPEYSVILAQYFIVPFKNFLGKCTE